MKEYAEPRKIFTNSFSDTKSYIYAALNLGNLGALQYGPVCLKVVPELQQQPWMFIENDSLDFVENKKVMINKLGHAVADASHAGHLAIKKHGVELALTNNAVEWANLLCPPQKEQWKVYIEAIITNGPVAVSNIKSIYFDKAVHNQMIDIGAKTEEERTEVEQLDFASFEYLENYCFDHDIPFDIL